MFNSLQYAAFLPAVLMVYWHVGHRARLALLLGASWFFYALFDWRFLGLMLISTLTDYTVGRLLAATDDQRRRSRIFAVSLVVNLGILGYFKYADFFATSAAHLLRQVGLRADLPVLHVLLPVGISFYTFHGMSYTFDLYRRRIEPAKNLLTFAVFVAYFPQLVAGPIGRAHIQLPQFESPRERPSWERVRSGLFLILLGLFKKIAIADALAPYVNAAHAAPGSAGWRTLLVGTYGFALQIYGDFSGYTDIARGSSRLLGIELPVNFDQPYLSRNITEFWQRWHISLSTWLRDYLYIPLGGNRGSETTTYRNLMLTMLLGGLWHGASWTFVVWGAIHGCLLALHRRFRRGRPGVADATKAMSWRDVIPILATFHVAAAAFILFRARTFTAAAHYVGGLVTLRPGPLNGDAVITVIWAAAALFGIDLAQRLSADELVLLRLATAQRGAALAALTVPLILFSGGTPVPFIYFQF